jgi:hypothetical protein
MCGQSYRRCTYITWTCLLKHSFQVTLLMITEHTHRPPWASTQDVAFLNHDCPARWGISDVLWNNLKIHFVHCCKSHMSQNSAEYTVDHRSSPRKNLCDANPVKEQAMLSIHPVPSIAPETRSWKNYQNARKCSGVMSCIIHKRILVNRSTFFNSSGREFHGT